MLTWWGHCGPSVTQQNTKICNKIKAPKRPTTHNICCFGAPYWTTNYYIIPCVTKSSSSLLSCVRLQKCFYVPLVNNISETQATLSFIKEETTIIIFIGLCGRNSWTTCPNMAKKDISPFEDISQALMFLYRQGWTTTWTSLIMTSSGHNMLQVVMFLYITKFIFYNVKLLCKILHPQYFRSEHDLL